MSNENWIKVKDRDMTVVTKTSIPCFSDTLNRLSNTIPRGIFYDEFIQKVLDDKDFVRKIIQNILKEKGLI